MSKKTIIILSSILVVIFTVTISLIAISSSSNSKPVQSIEKHYTSADINAAYNEGFAEGEKAKLPYIEQVASLQVSINTLTSEKNTLQNSLISAQQQITSLQQDIANKDSNITQLNNRIENLQNQISILNADKQQLNANIQTLNAQIADLTEENEYLQSLVDTDLVAQVTALENENASLNSQVSFMLNTTIPALQQQLTNFTNWCKDNLYIQYTFTTSTSEETLYSKYYSTIVLPNQINGETIKEYAVYNDNTNESTIINPGTFSLQDSGYRFYAIKNNENIVMYYDFNNSLIHVDIAQSCNYSTWSNVPAHITTTCSNCGATYTVREAWDGYYWNNTQWSLIIDENYNSQYDFNDSIDLNRNLKLKQAHKTGTSTLHIC